VIAQAIPAAFTIPNRKIRNHESPMPRRRDVVRLGVPALIVAALAIVALWRIGMPVQNLTTVGTTGTAVPGPSVPLTQVADLLLETSAGRKASLERVQVRQVTSPRTFWIGGDAAETRAFVVLDPDVKRSAPAPIVAGEQVSLIGLVRPAPSVALAMRQWSLDEATAREVVDRGTYLHATEVHPAQ
jgi:hypothetical protein